MSSSLLYRQAPWMMSWYGHGYHQSNLVVQVNKIITEINDYLITTITAIAIATSLSFTSFTRHHTHVTFINFGKRFHYHQITSVALYFWVYTYIAKFIWSSIYNSRFQRKFPLSHIDIAVCVRAAVSSKIFTFTHGKS